MTTRPTPETAPALTREAVQYALDKAWLASNDAHDMARPPDLGGHLYEALAGAAPADEDECQYVFGGTRNRCKQPPTHGVHIYGAWSGPEEYHLFTPEPNGGTP